MPFLRVNEISNGLVVLTDKTVFFCLKKFWIDNLLLFRWHIQGILLLLKVEIHWQRSDWLQMSIQCTLRVGMLLFYEQIFLKALTDITLWSFLHSSYGQNLMWRSASQTGQPHITLPIINENAYSRVFQEVSERGRNLYEASVQKKKSRMQNTRKQKKS